MVVSVQNMENEKRKEACAIETMCYMLREYAIEKNVSFETAMTSFVDSIVYQTLFDFDTGVWKEGPDYLRHLFDVNS